MFLIQGFYWDTGPVPDSFLYLEADFFGMYRRILAIFMIFFLVGSTAGAVDSSIFLREGNETIFFMNLFVEREVSPEGKYVYTVDYFLNPEKDFKSVGSEGFTVTVYDQDYDTLLTKELDGWYIEEGEVVSGSSELVFDEEPEGGRIFFTLNYSADTGTGGVRGTAEGGYSANFTFVEPEVEMDGFPGNVYRDVPVEFDVSTVGIENLGFLDGELEATGNNSYRASWMVPDGTPAGRFSKNIRFRGAGRVFRKNVSMNIRNRPPNISIGLSEDKNFSYTHGTFVVNVVDDSPNVSLYLGIDGVEVPVSQGTNEISRIVNGPGRYGFLFRANDSDGAIDFREGNFSVKWVKDEEQAGNESSESEEGSGRVPFFGPARDWLVGCFEDSPLMISGATGIFILLVFVYLLFVTD